MSTKKPRHPGRILLKGFLEPMGITQVSIANHMGISTVFLNLIVNGKSGITARTAWLLGQSLGTPADYWTTLQSDWDLALAKPTKSLRRLECTK